jgi:hypothetical protein
MPVILRTVSSEKRYIDRVSSWHTPLCSPGNGLPGYLCYIRTDNACYSGSYSKVFGVVLVLANHHTWAEAICGENASFSVAAAALE